MNNREKARICAYLLIPAFIIHMASINLWQNLTFGTVILCILLMDWYLRNPEKKKEHIEISKIGDLRR